MAQLEHFGVDHFVRRQIGDAVRLEIRLEFHAEQIVLERFRLLANDVLVGCFVDDDGPSLRSESMRDMFAGITPVCSPSFEVEMLNLTFPAGSSVEIR